MAVWSPCAEPMARLPYRDPRAASPEVREALDALPPLNIFRMLAHADSAFIPYLGFAGALLAQLELDSKLRELAILLVATRTGAELSHACAPDDNARHRHRPGRRKRRS
jgi:hypothetical protein